MPLKKSVTKSVQQEKHARMNAVNTKVSKGSTGAGVAMKMTVSSTPSITSRLHHRKVLRLAGKRPNAHHHSHHHHRSVTTTHGTGKGRPRSSIDPHATCDNSDDSGLGFENHVDVGRTVHYNERTTSLWTDAGTDIKRRKMDLKMENDDTNDGYCFPETLKNSKENHTIIRNLPCSSIQNISRNIPQNLSSSKNITRCLPLTSRRAPINGPITLTTQLSSSSRNGKTHLQIMCQPEQQHRARYQTEGSRGAVKDRTGNGFPIVKLIGYDKPTTLQVFIGTDLGRVAPHMFYQACRVSGKNSTPCVEKKIDGTIVIEVELDSTKDMTATCDCVGILKERNVDVEHRFPEQLSPRSKKKSTKCRMVFRTSITNDDGITETLQVCSQPIVCTQPPGIPEICKKSLTSCSVTGGLELFILGKNFLKDTKVVFQQQTVFESSGDCPEIIWEEIVVPDKEYLQQTHLVCVVPPYMSQDVNEPITVRFFVLSSGKNSESHSFVYTPVLTNSASTVLSPISSTVPIPAAAAAAQGGGGGAICVATTTPSVVAIATASANTAVAATAPSRPTAAAATALAPAPTVHMETNVPPAPFLSKMLWQTGTPKQESDIGMMPPPTTLLPLVQRRSSTNTNFALVETTHSPPMRMMKTELLDETSQGSVVMEHMINENSLDMRHRFGAISGESSLDVHHDNANMSLINENSIEMLRQQEIIKNRIEVMNENSNSVHSFCEKSNHSIHNEDSRDSNRPAETRIYSQTKILNPHHVTQTEIQASEMKGIDLRMKSNLVALNDLANTQPPSLATLRRFVLTEPSNIPLPAQTGQSVENYLTTIENNINKTATISNSVANSVMRAQNDQLMLQSSIQMLSTDTTVTGATKLFLEQPVIGNNQLLTNSLIATNPNREILPNLNESHLKTGNTFEQNLISSGPIMQANASLMLSQQNLQTLNANILQNSTPMLPKLDALVNSAVETHIRSPTKSPQQELLPSSPPQEILQQSPLISPQQSEILITHAASQPTLLTSTIASNEMILHSSANEIVSPTGTILNNICPQSVLQTNSIQSEILSSDSELRNSATNQLIANSPPVTVTVESIVINAAVDYLETQKKINEITRMENRLLQEPKTAQEQNLINSLLDATTSPSNQQILQVSNTLLNVANNTANQDGSFNNSQQVLQVPNSLLSVGNNSVQQPTVMQVPNAILDIQNNSPNNLQVANALLDVRSSPTNQDTNFTNNQQVIQQVTNAVLRSSPEHNTTSFSPPNTLLDVRSNSSNQDVNQNHTFANNEQVLQVSELLKLSHSQFISGTGGAPPNILSSLDLQATKQPEESKTEIKLTCDTNVVRVQQTTELKKNEESMIPPGLTNMSDNDLISYINPSCFDQGTFST